MKNNYRTVNQNLTEEDVCLVDKTALDKFFPEVEPGIFQAICLNNGVIGVRCPNNNDGLCTIKHTKRPRYFYHPWDGKNVYKCPCG